MNFSSILWVHLYFRLAKKIEDQYDQMVELGFEGIKGGYLVLMPKEKRTAKRIGYTITTAVNYGLRRMDAERSIRYWTYHHDDEHYAIMLVSATVLESLGL